MKIVAVLKIASEALQQPPTPEKIERMGQLVGEMMSKGVLLDTGGVLPKGVRGRVRNDGTTLTVTEGPFTETKELISGFAVLDVPTKEDAIYWSKRFMELVGPGEWEFIQVDGASE